MYKKVILSAFLILVVSTTIGQSPCNSDIFPDIKGVWSRKADALSGARDYGLTSVQVTGLSKKMDLYEQFVVRYNPLPSGVDISWYKYIGMEPLFPNGPQPFEIKNYISKYNCVQGKWKSSGDGLAEITIYGNTFFDYAFKTPYLLNGSNIYALPYHLDDLKGYMYSEPEYSAANGGSEHIYYRAFLITRNDKLPYRVLTRKEILDYLGEQADLYRKNGINSLSKMMKVRPKAEQDAEKNKEINYYKTTFPDKPNRLERYLKEYKTDEEKVNEAKLKYDVEYAANMERLSFLRKRYENNSNEPAVVDKTRFSFAYSFKNWDFKEDKKADDHFCDINCNHGQMLAILNEGYFDPKIPRNVPQFFTVIYSWVAGSGTKYRSFIYERILNDWKSKFDIAGLSKLVGQ
jgi:hypothetical protein